MLRREEFASVVARMALHASALLGAWALSPLAPPPSAELWRAAALLGGTPLAAL